MGSTNRMSRIFLFSILLSVTFQPFAQQQNIRRCGTYDVLEKLYRNNPGLKEKMADQRAISSRQSFHQSANIQARSTSTLTIPLAVHIVLPNPNIISNQQVLSQVEVLNIDFAGLNNDSTRIPAAFRSLFGKGRIRFCLDTITGIVRKSSVVKSVSGINDPIKYAANGGSDALDPTKYLNIWVCDNIANDFIGYSFTPSIPLSVVPLNERGFVNSYKHFGKGANVAAPYNLGRTAVHEIGHFFNLEHIWGLTNCDGSDNCGDDDSVNDTPLQNGCNYGAPDMNTVITDACSPIAPGTMWMNYMNYVDDLAMVMFTPQQHARMEASLSNYIWMVNLANNNACTPAQIFERDVRFVGLNNSLTSINSTFQYACNNAFLPNITIRNLGSKEVTSLKIESTINNGTPVITNWAGTLESNGEISINLNSIPVNTGTNPNLRIEIKQVNDQEDQNPTNNSYTGSGIIFPLFLNLPLTEGFELPTFPPNNWRLTNPDNVYTWERTTNAAKTGTGSVYFNNFNAEEYGQEDLLISPLIPAKGRDSIFVSFQVAAATYKTPSTITQPTDTLQVLVTGDCGITYSIKYNKAGINLVTTGNVPTLPAFIPKASQWRKDSVFIGVYDNNSTDYIQIAFKNINNFENNIYIDDISIYNRPRNTQSSVNDILTSDIKTIYIYPNPFTDQIIINRTRNFNKPIPYRIVNIFGQEIIKGVLADQKSTINLQSFSSGIYLFHTKEEIVKIIKK